MGEQVIETRFKRSSLPCRLFRLSPVVSFVRDERSPITPFGGGGGRPGPSGGSRLTGAISIVIAGGGECVVSRRVPRSGVETVPSGPGGYALVSRLSLLRTTSRASTSPGRRGPGVTSPRKGWVSDRDQRLELVSAAYWTVPQTDFNYSYIILN